MSVNQGRMEYFVRMIGGVFGWLGGVIGRDRRYVLIHLVKQEYVTKWTSIFVYMLKQRSVMIKQLFSWKRCCFNLVMCLCKRCCVLILWCFMLIWVKKSWSAFTHRNDVYHGSSDLLVKSKLQVIPKKCGCAGIHRSFLINSSSCKNVISIFSLPYHGDMSTLTDFCSQSFSSWRKPSLWVWTDLSWFNHVSWHVFILFDHVTAIWTN